VRDEGGGCPRRQRCWRAYSCQQPLRTAVVAAQRAVGDADMLSRLPHDAAFCRLAHPAQHGIRCASRTAAEARGRMYWPAGAASDDVRGRADFALGPYCKSSRIGRRGAAGQEGKVQQA